MKPQRFQRSDCVRSTERLTSRTVQPILNPLPTGNEPKPSKTFNSPARESVRVGVEREGPTVTLAFRSTSGARFTLTTPRRFTAAFAATLIAVSDESISEAEVVLRQCEIEVFSP